MKARENLFNIFKKIGYKFINVVHLFAVQGPGAQVIADTTTQTETTIGRIQPQTKSRPMTTVALSVDTFILRKV